MASKKSPRAGRSPRPAGREGKTREGAPLLDRRAWAQAALQSMAENGTLRLSVEAIARKLEATKGSFYWHFSSQEELLVAALELWEELGTEGVIDELEAIEDPRERLQRLFAIAFDTPEHLAVEGAIYAASDNPAVATIIRRVSKRRLRYLVSLYASLGMKPAEARQWGFLAYSAFVGALTVARSTGGLADLERTVRHFNTVLVPDK